MKSYKGRIFVVDDDGDDRELLFTAFSKYGLGADVQLVASGKELFTSLNRLNIEELPKLIILDHQTPDISGSDTLSLLKSTEKYKYIPVVIYSSALTPSMKVELKKKQAAMSLVKATTLEEYQEHIALFDSLAQ